MSHSRMSGYWIFAIGGAALLVLLLALEPGHGWVSFVGMPETECTNYGGNGNAGPFAYSQWEYLLPLLAAAWTFGVFVEQLFAVATATQRRSRRFVKAAVAIALAGSTSIGILSLAFACS